MTILVVAPHPDDETLGCGGTLLRAKAQGESLHWLVMTAATVEGGYSESRVKQRANEIREVAACYGFSSVHLAPFPTTTLDQLAVNVLVDEVSEVMRRVQPDTVYVPFRDDVHSDHRCVFDAVASCTKSFRYPFVRRVRAYETVSETEFSIKPGAGGFQPNLWVDISAYMHEKIAIMHRYHGQMQEHPFPRSERNLRALATLRGATAGVDYAEAFMSIKEIIR
jgi:N-acetylglucosamine malate deacetylase 1